MKSKVFIRNKYIKPTAKDTYLNETSDLTNVFREYSSARDQLIKGIWLHR